MLYVTYCLTSLISVQPCPAVCGNTPCGVELIFSLCGTAWAGQGQEVGGER